jgi:hypothetical protein
MAEAHLNVDYRARIRSDEKPNRSPRFRIGFCPISMVWYVNNRIFHLMGVDLMEQSTVLHLQLWSEQKGQRDPSTPGVRWSFAFSRAR